MKNKDLIKKLQEFDDDLEVVPYTFKDFDNIVYDITEIKIGAKDYKNRIYKGGSGRDAIEEGIDACDNGDGDSDEDIKTMNNIHNVLLVSMF